MSAYTNFQIVNNSETQMEVVRKINVHALIQEVQKHPIIYNNTPKQTQNTETKKKIWDKIAAKLCGQEQFQQYSESEKDSLGKEIQLKWKNLKDNYHRILRKQKEDEVMGIPSYKRKKYIYYDELEFLKPFAPTARNTEVKEEVEMEGGINASNIIYINETDDAEEDTYIHMPPSPLKSVPKVQQPLAIAPKPTIPNFGTLQPVQFIQLPPSTSLSPPDTAKEEDNSALNKLSEILEKIIKTQEEQKSDDLMGNKEFLMSLLPFLSKLPDDVNLEVRLQIMAVLQNYSAKDFY